jgi:FdhE protein
MALSERPWEEIAEYLNEVRRRRPAVSEVVDLQRSILRVQYEVARALADASVETPEGSLAERNRQGLPLVPRKDFEIDLTAAAALFGALLQALSEAGGPARERALAIRRELEARAFDLVALLRSTLRGEEDGALGGPEFQPLQLLAEATIRPHAEAVACALGRWVQQDRWARAACPVCGSAPRIAELRGEELAASRYLHCGFCGWAWPYRRSGCPFCETVDHRALELLTIEDDPRVKIETCRQCQRYIKVVDNKEFFGLIPWLEEVTTPHLDLLAQERGYR